ncbi:MAG: hypothetical protein K2K54_10870 [Lachnospiraceae bacterium]|nr:hypothetical protein [Lachnospiraceae bacterium]
MSEIDNLEKTEYGVTQTYPAKDVKLIIENVSIRIWEDMRQIKRSYLSMGMTFKYVRDNRLYLEDDTGDYANVYQWGEEKFGISRTTVIRCIEICEQFPVNQETMELEGKYSKFSYSQMIELLPMDHELRETITPEMPVRQIRKIYKEYKNGAGSSGITASAQNGSEIPSATSHLDGTAGNPVAESIVQTKFPVSASDEEMREWLMAPEKWEEGLWYTDENIEPHFHFIYSDEYLRQSDLYTQEVDRYYSNDTVTVEFLIEFLREMQEETETYSEEDTYRGQIPGQMALSELMDMENDEADGIIEAYSLEDSAVIKEIWDVLNDEGMDADIVNEKSWNCWKVLVLKKGQR